MSKEQIEEMADDLLACHTEFESGVGEIYTDYDTTAQKMFAKGYRKQSEPISCGHEKGGEWISVSERLPEPLERVVAFDSHGNLFTAVYINFATGKNAWCSPLCYGGEITHWMPLPEPPVMKGSVGK